ncbi:MAG: hypothetical protein ACRDSG_05145 [Pseudonocardiaceae bacterium]
MPPLLGAGALLSAEPLLGAPPLQVIGVGVGDGSVDAPLAAALAADGRRVHYTGIEPHALSAAGFVVRLAALPADSLTVTAVAVRSPTTSPRYPPISCTSCTRCTTWPILGRRWTTRWRCCAREGCWSLRRRPGSRCELALPGRPGVVPHPIDITIVRVP